MTSYIWLFTSFALGYGIHWLQTSGLRNKLLKAEERQSKTILELDKIQADLAVYQQNMDDIMQDKSRKFNDMVTLSNEILGEAMTMANKNGALSEELSELRARYDRTLAQFN